MATGNGNINRIINPNGEVSMNMKMPKLHNSDWKRRISLVLIFTMIFSTFMYEGWYGPDQAEAAAVGASSPVLARVTGGTTALTYTVTNAQFACGAGQNR